MPELFPINNFSFFDDIPTLNPGMSSEESISKVLRLEVYQVFSTKNKKGKDYFMFLYVASERDYPIGTGNDYIRWTKTLAVKAKYLGSLNEFSPRENISSLSKRISKALQLRDLLRSLKEIETRYIEIFASQKFENDDVTF